MELTRPTTCFLLLWLCCLTGVLAASKGTPKGTWKIKGVLVVARHGNRGPDPELTEYCPHDKSNFKSYASTYEGDEITPLGAAQTYCLGKALRHRYFKLGLNMYDGDDFDYDDEAGEQEDNSNSFLSNEYSPLVTTMSAAGAVRTRQTASVLSQTLYPSDDDDGDNLHLPDPPNRWAFGRRSVAPFVISALPEKTDDTLSSSKTSCKKRKKYERALYEESDAFHALLSKNKDLIDLVGDLCGADMLSGGDGDVLVGDRLHVVADALQFDHLQGLPPLAGLNDTIRQRFLSISHQMCIGRDFGYNGAGDPGGDLLPQERSYYWLGNFLESVETWMTEAAYSNTTDGRLNAVAVHREFLYALSSHFGGRDGLFRQPGWPGAEDHGAISPGTALVAEVYVNEELKPDWEGNPQTQIRWFAWYPHKEGNWVNGSFVSLETKTRVSRGAGSSGDDGLPDTVRMWQTVRSEFESEYGDWEDLCDMSDKTDGGDDSVETGKPTKGTPGASTGGQGVGSGTSVGQDALSAMVVVVALSTMMVIVVLVAGMMYQKRGKLFPTPVTGTGDRDVSSETFLVRNANYDKPSFLSGATRPPAANHPHDIESASSSSASSSRPADRQQKTQEQWVQGHNGSVVVCYDDVEPRRGNGDGGATTAFLDSEDPLRARRN
eukprot:TRINITY_DN9087_c0_g1_i1.p1 TRINITY_DN9087_c0_g1~~TRINITY_DN9087_c0_g1_i1.p1  ORF type:complete len:662 (-),score=145.69 TRINITY_DN9087_c0_g1_i1:34-2019(-)